MLAGLGRGWPGESAERLYASPGSYCLNVAPVFSFDAQEIIQKPGYVIMVSDDTYRVIPTDGRPAINQNAKFWMGTSRGRWDGDTLVVDVTSLNGKGWFDSTGQFYSENTRMVERWVKETDEGDDIATQLAENHPYYVDKRAEGTGPDLSPEQEVEQIKAQMERLVPVHKVNDLTVEGPHLERELALVKVQSTGEKRVESLRIADIFRAKVVDSTNTSFVFETTGSTEKINAFIKLMEPLGLIDVCRTGVVAISRGPAGL